MDAQKFCELLPKVELHAHLNGSLSEETLKRLGCLDNSIAEYQSLLQVMNKTEKTLDECFGLFKVAHELTKNKTAVYLATQSVIQEFFKDNVIYLELRTTPRAEENMTKEGYIESVVRAIKDNERDIIVKLILSIDRRHDTLSSYDTLSIILKMKNKYPDVIKGIDLSGNPNTGKFDIEMFEKARDHCLNITIHCAEVRNDEEVREILQFGPNRIGHATALHPKYGGSQENWEVYCRKKIPAEFCLTSNVVCGTSNTYKVHHMQEWIKNDLPFSINTDDKGVFCTTLSKEYKNALCNFNLSKTDLWTITYNAMDHSFASIDEKTLIKHRLDCWKKENSHYF